MIKWVIKRFQLQLSRAPCSLYDSTITRTCGRNILVKAPIQIGIALWVHRLNNFTDNFTDNLTNNFTDNFNNNLTDNFTNNFIDNLTNNFTDNFKKNFKITLE